MKKNTLIPAVVLAAALCMHSARGQETVGARPEQPKSVSPEQAFMLMTGEAEKGNAAAMLTLGTMYERGLGTPRNFTSAFEWYRKAADAGLAEGYYNLGVCYEIGMGAAGDAEKAFANFERSAELKLPQGLYKLAALYINGTGVSRNVPWGVELLGRAASINHAGAAYTLGAIALEGSYGQPKDVARAFDWFSKSAELGNAEAMRNLALFYRDGIGRPADPKQELKWFALARLAGYPAATLNPAIDKVRASLTEAEIAQVEKESREWVQAFQQRQQQMQQ